MSTAGPAGHFSVAAESAALAGGYPTGSGSLPAAHAPMPTAPPIPLALDQVDSALARLGATVEGLIGRLEPVLPTARGVNEVAGDALQAGLSPLAERLQTYAHRIDQIQRAVASVSDRIEL